VTLGQISPRNVAIRTEIILNLVLKFQVNLTSFHGEDVCARKKWESGKEEVEEKERIERS